MNMKGNNMKIDNILCPIDFSELSDSVTEQASIIARRHGGTLHFVHVYEPVFADGYMEGMVPLPVSPDFDGLRERLQEFKPTGLNETPCCHELLVGFPASSLIHYAATNDIDLIVIGTANRSRLDRILMGSVAESVMKAAPCPVLTLHKESPLANV